MFLLGVLAGVAFSALLAWVFFHVGYRHGWYDGSAAVRLHGRGFPGHDPFRRW